MNLELEDIVQEVFASCGEDRILLRTLRTEGVRIARERGCRDSKRDLGNMLVQHVRLHSSVNVNGRLPKYHLNHKGVSKWKPSKWYTMGLPHRQDAPACEGHLHDASVTIVPSREDE